MMYRSRILPTLAMALVTLAPVESIEAEEAFHGAWATFYQSGTLNGPGQDSSWRYGLYGDARHYDRAGGVNQFVLQPGFGYKLNQRFSLWGGYTYFHSEVGDSVKTDEQRAWQQLSWNMMNAPSARLTSRTRLEQRFRSSTHGTDMRLRQQFRFDARLDFMPGLVFILGDELFYHLRDTDWTRKGLGQNRLYTGVGFDLGELHVEALYMNQSIKVRNVPDLVNHLIVMNFRK